MQFSPQSNAHLQNIIIGTELSRKRKRSKKDWPTPSRAKAGWRRRSSRVPGMSLSSTQDERPSQAKHFFHPRGRFGRTAQEGKKIPNAAPKTQIPQRGKIPGKPPGGSPSDTGMEMQHRKPEKDFTFPDLKATRPIAQIRLAQTCPMLEFVPLNFGRRLCPPPQVHQKTHWKLQHTTDQPRNLLDSRSLRCNVHLFGMFFSILKILVIFFMVLKLEATQSP
ncbi:uncharacterized protein LOC132709342 [Pantherophis guttatus]|uniref:Uncharacterized protein LOC132709342 n=1 Tax=Pantherophis guttatus TaxID=94885 RepID=A0ABM3YRI0_PANGU|nr:uncharacterized protein LOC132709342 [Pantherophis guttatus]